MTSSSVFISIYILFNKDIFAKYKNVIASRKSKEN